MTTDDFFGETVDASAVADAVTTSRCHAREEPRFDSDASPYCGEQMLAVDVECDAPLGDFIGVPAHPSCEEQKPALATVAAQMCADPAAAAAVSEPATSMSKAAKRRAKERAKKQEALLAELRALDPGVAAVDDATPEQLAAATAATQRAAVAAKAEAAGATLDVELPLGAVRPEPTGSNPFPLVHKGFRRQTFPEPTVPVKQQFAAGRFLAGQLMEHQIGRAHV